MRRTSIFLLLLGLSACGTNEVRPRPSGHGPCIDEADADDQQSQTPPNASDGGVSNAPTNADAGVNAISPDSSVATLSPSPRCDGLVCDVFASCVGGDEPRCTCAPGLEGDGQRCSDIDECQQEAAVCSANAACENSFGGYSCRCNPGYKRQGDGCVADDACTASVCAADATCGEGEGQLSCVCDEASSGNGFFCTTMQPCADTPCGDDGACIAAAGAERDFVCACDQGYFGERSCAACGEELLIDDPELDRAVRQQLGLAPADARPILVAELSAYTALDASEFGVTNLAGLECWPALRVLDLSYNPALANEGAQVLASLNQLTELRLDCTLVTDLHVLDGHPNLRVLSLNVLNCDEPVRIDETSPLGTMPQLELLDVRGQRLTDASVLSALRNLRALWFGHNQLSSLGELPELPLLVELDVSFNQLGAIDEVARFSRLQYLNVSNNELVSLTPTESLSALRNVNASGNRVSTLPDWRDSDVVQIDVSANQIAAIGPLADLNRVAWVNIAANAITTLQPLLEGSLRGTLVVAGNPAACGEESSVIAELRAIGIDVQGQCTE